MADQPNQQGFDDFAAALAAALALAGARNSGAKPEPYDGKRETYETFRRTLELFVRNITLDRERIWTALTFMTKGDADVWAQTFTAQHRRAVDDGDYTWPQARNATSHTKLVQSRSRPGSATSAPAHLARIRTTARSRNGLCTG